MDQRDEFITDVETGLFTMTELADAYGVSRRTAYKWVNRHAVEGFAGLRDRSRRPHQSPTATDADVIEQLIALRTAHPRWGPKKLLPVLARRHPRMMWPSCATASAILKRHGLVAPPRAGRRRHADAPTGRAPITAPNDVWTTDFKGEFRTGDRVYCYPFTLRDGFSRFVLRCDALADCSHEPTRACFARAFATYGLPRRIRSDNGSPFAGPGVARLSRLAVWWIRLGIVPERIAPGHPEQNGSHEQFHAVLKVATTRPPAPHRRAQQRRFARFCHEYNHERPHEALRNESPASWYTPSPRPLPAHVPPVHYPSHAEVKRVADNGHVSWRGTAFFLSKALSREDVAFEETDDGIWTVSFATILLGRYDARHRTFHLVSSQTSAGRSAGGAGSAPDTTKPITR
jgi:transposase InsO family protein